MALENSIGLELTSFQTGLSGLMVSMSDFRLRGRGFDSRFGTEHFLTISTFGIAT